MKKRHVSRGTVGLKHVAEHLGLNPATVSVVLNNTPGRSIPEATRERIRAAARELNYQPSLVARSLQSRRTRIVGILLPDLHKGHYTQVLSGIAAELMDAGYFYFTAHHEHRKQHIEEYSRVLLQRGAEAVIAIDTLLEYPFNVPVVNVAGQQRLPGVTNVIVDHRLAAELLLSYLQSLGHRQIAFVRSQTLFGVTADEAWRSTVAAARKLGIHIAPELVLETEGVTAPHEAGHAAVRQLLSSRTRFTAVVMFNDHLTPGVLRGLQEAGLRVPEDISLAAFGDSVAAEMSTPKLTAVHHPFAKMGAAAARYLLHELEGVAARRKQILVEPELIVRESTTRVTSDP